MRNNGYLGWHYFPLTRVFYSVAAIFAAVCPSGLLPGAGLAEQSSPQAIAVDADFAGGNVQVEKVVGDEIYVRQDLRDTAGDWFYWYFRVRGAAGRDLTIHFTNGNVLGVRGAAVSLDAGRTWQWLGTDRVTGASFRFAVPAEAQEVRFSFGIPYLQSNLREFLDRHASHPALRAETLCRTEKGRDAELLYVGKLRGEPDHRVLLTRGITPVKHWRATFWRASSTQCWPTKRTAHGCASTSSSWRFRLWIRTAWRTATRARIASRTTIIATTVR